MFVKTKLAVVTQHTVLSVGAVGTQHTVLSEGG